jgi:hypothetical protein
MAADNFQGVLRFPVQCAQGRAAIVNTVEQEVPQTLAVARPQGLACFFL